MPFAQLAESMPYPSSQGFMQGNGDFIFKFVLDDKTIQFFSVFKHKNHNLQISQSILKMQRILQNNSFFQNFIP